MQSLYPHLARLSLSLVLCLPVSIGAAELSFGDALARLRKTNESLRAAQAEVRRRVHNRAAARGLYLPRLEINGRFTRIDDPITIDLNGIREAMLGLHPQVPAQMIPAFEESVQDNRFWRVNATLTWPVFTGGRIQAANRAAEAVVAESREKLRATEGRLMSELAQRYFGLRLALEVVDVRCQVLQGMETHLSNAKKLEENGMIARGERLHATVARAEAARQYKAAVHDLETVRTALNQLLSRDEPVEPATPLFLASNVGALQEFIETAHSGNPVLGQIVARRNQAHQGYRKEAGTFLPEVFIFGTRELYEDDLTTLDARWAAGIGARFTLFDGLARSNRLKAARAVEHQIQSLERDARRKTRTLVELRYRQMIKAREQFEMLESSAESAKELLRVRMRSFEEGMGTSLNIVDARLMLSRVQIERLVAVYGFDVALAELLEASGCSHRFASYLNRAEQEVKR